MHSAEEQKLSVLCQKLAHTGSSQDFVPLQQQKTLISAEDEPNISCLWLLSSLARLPKF